MDLYIKYIKYKNKYLKLKNKFELTGGASFNKFKNLKANLDLGSERTTRLLTLLKGAPQGKASGDKKLTYLIQDNQGLYHDRLREILNSEGFTELTKQQALSAPNKYVDFFWMGQSNVTGDRFDKDLYQIKSKLVTMLWRDKSHTQGKDAITNKQLLYQNMKKYFPDICSKHMAKTYLLKDINSLKDINFFENELSDMTSSEEASTSEDSLMKGETLNKTYIVKPVGHGACAGVGVTVVTNDKELEEARRELSKRFRNIIISEYIQNPLLYEGRKFHIRMYILINSDSTWSFWKRGKAMTAKISYKKGDWTNKDIHDSHGETTPKDIYFPEDIAPKEKYEYVYEQIELILGAAANIVKPHVKCYEESKNCCEVFGIDFMITDDYTVKLIEINAEAGYGAKNEDKTKYKQYCNEYFDWFYKESLLSKLFNKNSEKLKTYIFVDKEKEIEDEFTKLLDNNGWVRKDINDFPEYVDLFYSRNYKFFYNQLKNKQNYRKIFGIKSNLLSFFWRDDSYKKGKDVVVNKYQLYKNMKKQFPEIADKHMAKTFNILKKDIKINDGVYIIRPVGKSVGSGEGIEYVSNKKEFNNVVNKYKNNNKYKKVIASEYIQPLLKYNNKKFHIRVHILFLNNNGKITWSTNLHGRILCAKTDFVNSDYHNLEIHDTHGRYSTRNIYFPEEFNYGKENTDNVLSQMEIILSNVVEIVKPNLKCFTESNNCFEVFGIDFMIKDDFTVVLIEINDDAGNPSFPIGNFENEENNKLWHLSVKNYVKWIYDNTIAHVYNSEKDTKTLKLINYDNHFEENKKNLHLIYKYYQTKLNNIIEKLSPKKYVKKITWKIPGSFRTTRLLTLLKDAPDIKLPIIFNDYNDEKYTLKEFSELFNQYKLNFSKFSKIDISKYIKNIDNEIKDILNFIHSSRYISINIKQWIQNNIDVCYKYNYDHLELFYYTTSNSENLDDTINEINIITKWIYDINPIYKIRLHIFDTPQKKLLPSKLEDKYLGPKNVNGAFTSINEKKNYRDIFIWRKEDLYLTIIHELFHYLLLDAKFLNDEKYEKLFNNNIKSYLLLNESITEIMSNFFYIIYFSVRKEKKFDEFRDIYKKELEFNWYQTAKVLKFFNINSLEIDELDKIKSNTAVFSYIILKSILTTEFCEILFSFPYINKIFSNDDIKECNIYKCELIVNYIIKKVKSLPDKDINDLIKNTNITDDSLRRTNFS